MRFFCAAIAFSVWFLVFFVLFLVVLPARMVGSMALRGFGRLR